MYYITLLLFTDDCGVEGQVRLIGGFSVIEGRVEICFEGAWATVCDDFWNTAEASIVCQQLGYSSNGRISLLGLHY